LRSALVVKWIAEGVAEAEEFSLQGDSELTELRRRHSSKKFNAISWAGKGKQKQG
jgi:hypothetical protein